VAGDKPIRAILDVVGVPYQAYKLPADSRQWVQVCHERRAVVVELATHANADGSSIYASVATMAARIGIAERTFRYRLDELGEKGLGFVSNGTQRGVKGGRNRKLNVEAILKAAKTLQDSKAKPCKSEETNLAPVDKPCTTGNETLQEPRPNPAQVAANPAPYSVQPTALRTAQPTALPTETAKAEGGMVPLEILKRWQAHLPAPMNTEAMGRHEKAIAVWAKERKTVRLATAFVSAWISRRETNGLRDLWGAFLKEWPLHEKEARAMTPEGKAEDEARVEEIFQHYHKKAVAEAAQFEVAARIREECPWLEEDAVWEMAKATRPELWKQNP
jgi:hypothetical protein